MDQIDKYEMKALVSEKIVAEEREEDRNIIKELKAEML